MTASEFIAIEHNGELDKYRIIDVRTEDEYQKGHIKDSILIPDLDISSIEDIKNIDKSKHIIVYCRTGSRSYRVSMIFENAGYTVFNLEGGVLALMREGYDKLVT